MPKKVKVIIALAIDETGYWEAVGSSIVNGPDALTEVLYSMSFSAATNTYYIETEIETPGVKTIKNFIQTKL